MPLSGDTVPPDQFELVSHWRLDASIEEVWQILSDAERWPDWWPCVETVEQVHPGEPGGERSRWHYTWKTMLPYKLRMELCVTRIDVPILLEADVRGDVCGCGACRLARKNDQTIVRYEWKVRAHRSWMKCLAPIARPVFVWNHRMVMNQGEASLAAWLASAVARPAG